MVATQHTSRSATSGTRPVVRDGVEGGIAAVAHLVEQANALGRRAPDLARVLGERAAALAEAAGSHERWVRAEALVVHALVRLGHRAPTVGRAVAALRAAEDAGRADLAAQLRTDLAVCARSVGAPLSGLAALRPVLTVPGLSATQRATALCHLVGCLGTLGRRAELDRVLMEGDRLLAADDALGADDKLAARALLRVGVSGHRRRHGDLVGAADAARTGIGLLDTLEEPATDGGLARVRLVLELVCALLDRGEVDLAAELARPVLDEPERAANVAPTAWLRLAIATRVHLRSGAAEAAARMLRDAAHSAACHELHALAARLWLELSYVEERVGESSEAIQCLHRARAAEHRHGRTRSQARALLTGEFGSGEQAPVDLAEIISGAPEAASFSPPAPAPREQVEPEVVLPVLRVAAEPGPRPVAEPAAAASAVESSSAEPERATGEPERGTRGPERGTRERARHDAEHGSVAARSVLDRLGISAGSGGRRRAADGEPSTEPAAKASAESPPAGESPVREQPHGRDAPGTTTDVPDVPTASDVDEGYGWLPRLRLPPALAPLDELGAGPSGFEQTGLDQADAEPAPAYGMPDYDVASRDTGREPDIEPPLDDEPPPGAGLAELLTRALAEHRAGTSSAAALVKRLGTENGETDRPQRVNGRQHHDD